MNLKALNLVINLSVISNKAVSNTNLLPLRVQPVIILPDQKSFVSELKFRNQLRLP